MDQSLGDSISKDKKTWHFRIKTKDQNVIFQTKGHTQNLKDLLNNMLILIRRFSRQENFIKSYVYRTFLKHILNAIIYCKITCIILCFQDLHSALFVPTCLVFSIKDPQWATDQKKGRKTKKKEPVNFLCYSKPVEVKICQATLRCLRRTGYHESKVYLRGEGTEGKAKREKCPSKSFDFHV